MDNVKYNNFEQRLIKNENISFVKSLIERDIKNYKYDIMNENIINYVHNKKNEHLYKTIKNYNISDQELNEIQSSIIKTSNYNLEIEYLPTEDWEFDDIEIDKKEFVIALPSYEMISSALALIILVFPFAALFLSYFLIMIFR